MPDILRKQPPTPPHIAKPVAEAQAKITADAAQRLKELQKPIEAGRLEARRTLAKQQAKARQMVAKEAEELARRAGLPSYGAAYKARISEAKARIQKDIAGQYSKGLGNIQKQYTEARAAAETAVGEARTKALAEVAKQETKAIEEYQKDFTYQHGKWWSKAYIAGKVYVSSLGDWTPKPRYTYRAGVRGKQIFEPFPTAGTMGAMWSTYIQQGKQMLSEMRTQNLSPSQMLSRYPQGVLTPELVTQAKLSKEKWGWLDEAIKAKFELHGGVYWEKEQWEQLPQLDQFAVREHGYATWMDDFNKKNIQLPSGDYVPRTHWDDLTPEIQAELKEKGVDQYLRDEQIKFEVGKFKLETAIAKREELARVEAGKPIGERLAPLAATITGIIRDEDLSMGQKLKLASTDLIGKGADTAKEILTVSQAITETYNPEQIEADYDKLSLEVMKEGYQLDMTKDEYKQKVEATQPTLAELGMYLVPFEYLRAERVGELETWEKVVYPSLDVAILFTLGGALALKGMAVITKAASTGAKIAAQGGKQAVLFAAKESGKAVIEGTAKVAQKKNLLNAIKAGLNDLIKTKAPKSSISFQRGAVEAALKDINLASKELAQLTKQSNYLQKLAEGAKSVKDSDIAATAYRTTERTRLMTAAASKRLDKPIRVAASGIISHAVIRNWDDLTPAQRAAGIAIAALPLGIYGKALSLTESAIVPNKIPIKALSARGGMDVSGKVPKLILDGTIDPKVARASVADLMRQLVEEGSEKAVTQTGGRIQRVKGTGFQEIVGPAGLTGTPMGRTMIRGSASHLEQYLGKSGLTVVGKEGGMFFSYGLPYQFSWQSAYGKTGELPSAVVLGIQGIDPLPKQVAMQKTMQAMEREALKLFNDARTPGQFVEGFKQYQAFMEFESVATNASQLYRVQNLRSRLAERLHLNKGEYYTRTNEGRIELIQMYMSGGRSTPYTLTELYRLKGKALTNTLEDLFDGLIHREKWLKARQGKKVDIVTKEEELDKIFKATDQEIKSGRLSSAEATKVRENALREFRQRYSPKRTRTEIRRDITQLAARVRGITRQPLNYALREGRMPRDERRLLEESRRLYGERDRIGQVTRDESGRVLAERGARIVGPRATRVLPVREERVVIPREPRVVVPRAPRVAVPRAPRVVTPRVPRVAVPRVPVVKVPKVPKVPLIPLKGVAAFERLTPEQKRGTIVWKQGWYYWALPPPYRQVDLIGSMKPFPGVKVHKGAKSAYRSVARVKGVNLPDKIDIDLGIMDITFLSDKKGRDVVMHYKPDVKEITTATPPLELSRSTVATSAKKKHIEKAERKPTAPMAGGVR